MTSPHRVTYVIAITQYMFRAAGRKEVKKKIKIKSFGKCVPRHHQLLTFPKM
jgi:hypothetical protein